MKANEAPEKIYVHVKNDKALNTWNSMWIGVNDIEYTRTDAFIEKACEWLEEHLLDFWSQRITNTDYFIEEFKKNNGGIDYDKNSRRKASTNGYNQV